MRCFDLHCDTISRCYNEKKTFNNGDLQINAVKGGNIENYRQYFALWLSDEFRGETAFSLCKNMLCYYENNIRPSISECGNITPHLSIENASAFGGDLNNIGYFRSRGVEMVSLTWNGENELASGVNAKGGLKTHGREAVREMENCGIMIDVSHLNEKGFRDLCEWAKKPFVATHSNCYDIYPHKRNLKKWQIKEIISRNGLIGLNFYPLFLGTGQTDVFGKIRDNIEYLLSLGGENNIAFGSDFDGAEMSAELDGIDKIGELYRYLLSSGLSESIAEKIFYGNAVRIMNCSIKPSLIGKVARRSRDG